MILKICNFKKGEQGSKVKKLCKKANDQNTIQTRWNSIVVIEQKVDSKTFAIPILTASAFIINFLFYNN